VTSRVLAPFTALEEAAAAEALKEPPPNVTGGLLLVAGSAVWFARRLGASPERATIVDICSSSAVQIELLSGVSHRATPSQLTSRSLDEWEAEVLCTYHSDHVARRDLRLLRPLPPERLSMAKLLKFWVNTQIVNTIGRLLTSQFSHVRVFDSSFMHTMARSGAKVSHPSIQRMLVSLLTAAPTQAEFFGEARDPVELWLWPYCSSNHWYVICFDFRLEISMVVDSMGRKAEHVDAARLAQILTQELYRLGNRAGATQWSKWRFSSLDDASPQQAPGEIANCGIFMLAVFWCLARRVPLSTVRAEDMGRWRARLALWAVKGFVPA